MLSLNKNTCVVNDMQLMVDNPPEPRTTVTQCRLPVCDPNATTPTGQARCCSLLFQAPKPSLRRAERFVPGQIKLHLKRSGNSWKGDARIKDKLVKYDE